MGYQLAFLWQADFSRQPGDLYEELMKLSGASMKAFPVAGGKERLTLTYEPDIEEAFFEDELNRAKEKDRKYCSTSVGTHRDDISFFIRRYRYP